FTPTWEVKLNGSYTVPKIEVDLGARLRFATGRPVWRLDNYPELTANGGPPGGGVLPGGLPQVVAVDPNQPDPPPSLTILDLPAEKQFKFHNGTQSFHLVVDGFNIFNTDTPTDMSVIGDGYGRVTNIPQGRRFRLGVRYQF